MVVKDGVAYLQAGGGIVFDSDPYDEWMETINKLGANMQCITSAEEKHLAEQAEGDVTQDDRGAPAAPQATHISLAAG
jgi:anthranilate synthase component 1